MFVRIKRIKGQKYAYLVQNSWTKEGTRQKVAKYLGKVLKPEKRQNKGLKEFLGIENLPEYISRTELKGILKDLVLLELHNHGLPSELFSHETLTFAEGSRGLVLEINQGYLCSHTLNSLLQYKSEDDEGFKLADLLLGAGLSIEQDFFVGLFERLKPKTQPSVKPDEFYY